MRMHNAEYARYYRVKYDESTKHKHKRALVLTARKLVRLVDAMLRHNQIYVSRPMNLNNEVNERPNIKARPAKQHRYRRPIWDPYLVGFLNSRLPRKKGELLPKDAPYFVVNVQPSKLDISPQDFLHILSYFSISDKNCPANPDAKLVV